MKTCPRCGRTLPAIPDNFYRNKCRYDGLSFSCKPCERIYTQKYNEQHAKEKREYRRLYHLKNFEREQERDRRRRQQPRVRIRQAISAGVRKSLEDGKNGRSWESLVGYTLAELMAHLESQFTKGMTWENRGQNGWHIDHIKPMSHFNFTSPDDPEFLECWSLWNLRPVWGKENMSRGNRVGQHPLPLLHKGSRKVDV